jgi:hypothetical protein
MVVCVSCQKELKNIKQSQSNTLFFCNEDCYIKYCKKV